MHLNNIGKKKKTSTEMEKATTEETEAGRGETNVSDPPHHQDWRNNPLPCRDLILSGLS